MRLWCHIGAICISVFGIFRGIIYLNCGFLTAPNWWIFGSIFFIICNVVLFIGLVKNRTDCIKIWLIFQGIIESVSSNKKFNLSTLQMLIRIQLKYDIFEGVFFIFFMSKKTLFLFVCFFYIGASALKTCCESEKDFLRGWLLVLDLKEGLVECATVCVKSVVILHQQFVLDKKLFFFLTNKIFFLPSKTNNQSTS